MSTEEPQKLSKIEHEELCCIYASLILHEEKMEISEENMNKLIKASGNKIEPHIPRMYASALKDTNIDKLLTGISFRPHIPQLPPPAFHNNQPFGIYRTNHGSTIPLKDIEFNIMVRGRLMELTMHQNYINILEESSVECEYIFPIGIEMALTSLSIITSTRRIETHIEEKNKAEIMYHDAIARGNKPVEMSYRGKSLNILRLKIGKLSPLEGVQIEVRMTQILDNTNNIYDIRIPIAYSPRYHSYQSKSSRRHKQPIVVNGSEIPYGWKLNFQINTPSPIISLYYLESKIGNINVEYSNEGRQVIGKSITTQIPNEDININFSYEEQPPRNNSLILQYSPKYDEYAVMCSINPKIISPNREESEEIKEGMLLNSNIGYEYDIMESMGEHIFLLDCSGSMTGTRIQMAREAAAIFLRSLPPNSKFNIIFFGSTYNPMFPDASVTYQKENLEKALGILSTLGANLGGTEILPPMIYINKTKPNRKYPRNIYLITDGAVSYPEEVIREIREHKKEARVHSLGIGNGASKQLVIGAAEAGRGGWEFVESNGDIAAKVISLLSTACKPSFCDIQINWGVSEGDILYRLAHGVIYCKEALTTYAIMKEIPEEFIIELSGIEITSGKKSTWREECNKLESLQGESVFHIIAKEILTYDNNINKNKKIEISKRYCVICEETSFIGIERANIKRRTSADINEIVPVTIPVSTHKSYEGGYNNSYSYNNSQLFGNMNPPLKGDYLEEENEEENVKEEDLEEAEGDPMGSLFCDDDDDDWGGGEGYCAPPPVQPKPAISNSSAPFVRQAIITSASTNTPVLSGYKGIIQYQQFKGEWKLEEVDAWINSYRKKGEEYPQKFNIPKIILEIGLSSEDANTAFATIFALYMLNIKHIQDKPVWGLIEKKALKFLSFIPISHEILLAVYEEIRKQCTV